MPIETEVKFPVATHDRVRRALRRGGAEYLGTVIITDTYLDRPGGMLRKRDQAIRLRQVRTLRRGQAAVDDRPELTFKGPAGRSKRVKVRREVQTRLDCPHAAMEILEACGLKKNLVIEKRRASYQLGPCRIELDELPLIGRFVEIEGPDEETIHALAGQLRLTGEPNTDHYINLLRAACRRLGRSCREVTFARCEPTCQA